MRVYSSVGYSIYRGRIDIAAFFSFGERLELKLGFSQVWAFRPSRHDLFQVVNLSQPPFLFLTSSYNENNSLH